MTATRERDLAMAIAEKHLDQALVVARRIREPWFACQALAGAVRYAPDSAILALAREAIAAGEQSDDTYIVVGASAWTIRALIERRHTKDALRILDEMLRRAPSVQPPSSRADALLLLLAAAFPAGPLVRDRVLAELIRAAVPVEHWRQARCLLDAFLMIASADADLARLACRRVSDEKLRAKIERRLAAGECHPPRSFF